MHSDSMTWDTFWISEYLCEEPLVTHHSSNSNT